MDAIKPELRAFAEDLLASAPLRRDDRRIVTPRYVISLAQTLGPRSTIVSRLRLGADDVAAAVAEVREQLRHAGRHRAAWEIGDSATPATLGAQLQELGFVPTPAPFTVCTSMVLPGRPPQVGDLPDDLRITPVRTLDDYRRVEEIYWRGFDHRPEGDVEAAVRTGYERLGASPTWRRYLAWRGDQAVAAADAVCAPLGVILFGAATLPTERQRGAYRALVWARWQEALQRGTPYLITQAGDLSRPVLARLGFVETARIHNLIDSQF
jgi:hypothetical protein